MTGSTSAGVFVRWVRRRAALVADGGGPNARKLPEPTLGAPEAAHSEEGFFEAVGHFARKRRTEHGVLLRNVKGGGRVSRERLVRRGHGGLGATEDHLFSFYPHFFGVVTISTPEGGLPIPCWDAPCWGVVDRRNPPK